tara:strand:+ start:14372 stop:14542 length:171 start_codon:yes stop_codon:yes gene_type:complete
MKENAGYKYPLCSFSSIKLALEKGALCSFRNIFDCKNLISKKAALEARQDLRASLP